MLLQYKLISSYYNFMENEIIDIVIITIFFKSFNR